jgi:hypothetical protein
MNTTTQTTQADPWVPYEARAKKKSPVPEPAFYGLVLVGLVLVFTAWILVDTKITLNKLKQQHDEDSE